MSKPGFVTMIPTGMLIYLGNKTRADQRSDSANIQAEFPHCCKNMTLICILAEN